MKKKFLIRLGLYFIAPCMMLCMAWYWIFTHSHWDNIGLLNFQMAKLRHYKKKHFKVLFIGDSSCGNAIKTDKKNTLNLSLSGSYGYEGNTAFLPVISQYITYDTLVVINTIDIATRKVSEEAQWLPELYSDNILKKIIAFKNSFSLLKPVMKYAVLHKFDIGQQFDVNADYLVSRGKTKSSCNIIKGSILPDKVAEYCKLEQVLKAKKGPYFLLFGPSLPFDTSYFTALADTFRAHHIAHQLNQPFALNAENVGNTEDHIAPDFSHISTDHYYALFRSNKKFGVRNAMPR